MLTVAAVVSRERRRVNPEDIRYDEEFNPNVWLNHKKRELGIRGAHWLTGMSEDKDPFKRGTEGDFLKAYWFRGMHEQFGHRGIHLRKLHYRIISKPGMLLWDRETPYLNIDLHWEKLQEAGKLARLLRVVDAADFQDRYNKARPTLWQRGSLTREEVSYWHEVPVYEGALPASYEAGAGPKILRGLGYDHFTVSQEVKGYEFSESLQPIVIEIWSETEFDSFHRIANKYEINYIPLQGFASLTAIKTMLRRLQSIGKPGRILYVSDHDPAGLFMPTSFGRHCQFAAWELEEVAREVAPDIKVGLVAVTSEQVEEFDLPRLPIKTTDLRKARWELEHGEGAVEVEGMDAAVPGELERVLEERIKDLRDDDLESEVDEARKEAENRVDKAIKEVLDDHRQDFQKVRQHAGEVRQRYQSLYDAVWGEVGDRLRKLEQRFNRHMDPLKEDLQKVQEKIAADLEKMDVDLPELPEGDAAEDEDREWLFDSDREFVEQTNHFRRLKGEQVYG